MLIIVGFLILLLFIGNLDILFTNILTQIFLGQEIVFNLLKILALKIFFSQVVLLHTDALKLKEQSNLKYIQKQHMEYQNH